MLGVSELAHHTCEMATWDHHTHNVTTDMATGGGDNYVKESAAAMADHGEDIDNIDFGMLVVGNDMVDEDEDEEERLIKAFCLYEHGEQAKV